MLVYSKHKKVIDNLLIAVNSGKTVKISPLTHKANYREVAQGTLEQLEARGIRFRYESRSVNRVPTYIIELISRRNHVLYAH